MFRRVTMKYWILILVFISSFRANAECYPVMAMTLSPDLNTAFSVPEIGGGPFYEGFSWNTSNSQVTGQYNGIGQPGIYLTTEHLNSSRDGKYLVGVAGNYVMVWDVKSRARVLTKRTERYKYRIGYSEIAGNNLVFTTLEEYGDSIISFTVVDLNSKKVIYHDYGPQYATSRNTGVALSENGEILFLALHDGVTGKNRLARINIATGNKTEIQIVDYGPKLLIKDNLVYTYSGGWLRTYVASDLSFVKAAKYPDVGNEFRKRPSQLQISSNKGLIKLSARFIADLKTGHLIIKLHDFKDSFLSEDGSRLAATSVTGNVYIYDTSTWEVISKTCADL